MKKKVFLIISALLLLNGISAQTSSHNGYYYPVNGTIRAFMVFAEAVNDPDDRGALGSWQPGQMPPNADDFIDATFTNAAAIRGNVTKYFHEASFGNFIVLGDYYPNLIQINFNTISGNGYSQIISYLNNLPGSDIQTKHGYTVNSNDFDKWTIIDDNDGSLKTNSSDNQIDLLVIFWRNNSKYRSDRDGGHFYPYNHSNSIKGKDGINAYSVVCFDNPASLFQHEFSHPLMGDNDFHSGGAGAGIGTYMENYSGYSILSSDNRYFYGYNAWDRYRLGWKNPQHTYYISARNGNGNGQEVNADLDYLSQTADSTVFILRNFASTGDAVRVKLPYIRTLNQFAREQWIWIENHQLVPGNIEYSDYHHGANAQISKAPRGIYLNMQVGNEDFASFNNSSRTNYIAPINRFGKFDFTAYTTSVNVFGDVVPMGETSDAYANPFTGVGTASHHPYDKDGNNVIYNKEEYYLGKIKYNGVELGPGNFVFRQYTYYGSVFDAYYQGDKISISTNPAPATWITYACYDRFGTTTTPYSNFQPDDNRKIYLNGLSIRVMEQQANGDVKICIRWKDYDVKNDVRWCGDIVLKEKVNLLSGNTIILDQGLTPTRPNNPVTVNGNKVFANPTVFTCKQGSLLKANSGSTIHLKNNSALVAESGSVMELATGATLLVDFGSTFQIDFGATLQ